MRKYISILFLFLWAGNIAPTQASRPPKREFRGAWTVSYTHLTLPTMAVV